MDKLAYLERSISETVISAAQWYQLAANGTNHAPGSAVLSVATDSTLEFLAGPLNLVERIVVISDDFNDGRFFSIGRQIRQFGYRRRLSLAGDILPDQYTALRFCGYDDVIFMTESSTSEVVALDEGLAPGANPDVVSLKLESFTLTGSNL